MNGNRKKEQNTQIYRYLIEKKSQIHLFLGFSSIFARFLEYFDYSSLFFFFWIFRCFVSFSQIHIWVLVTSVNLLLKTYCGNKYSPDDLQCRANRQLVYDMNRVLTYFSITSILPGPALEK